MKQAWADRWWRSDDGLKLYARDYAGVTGPAKLPVVCLHGVTRNSRDFEGVAPWLAETGRRVIVPDARGRGRSQYDPTWSNYHPGTYVGDLIALLRDLGIGRAVFVGTSMGGLMTMLLAALKPEMIAGAVINDIGPRVAPQGLARIVAYAGKPVEIRSWKDARDYVKRTNGPAFPKAQDKDWKRFAARVFDEDARGRPVLAYDPMIAEPWKNADPSKPADDMAPLFKALAEGRPLMLVHGAISDLLDDSIVAEMREAAPHLRYVRVPGVGHAPMLTEPEAKAEIVKFLGELP
ncbi:MAG TPA: alpha/beta hydrolase [Caulobacteraceae bacterium]|nr:alpha/beta hydrolase [Caulobacteraceae bacterium]